MAACLRAVPGEIITLIAGYLPIPDIINLWQWSRVFHYSAKHLLFGSSTGLAHTMLWACKTGQVDVIRAAVAHGADPSYVCIHEPTQMARQRLDPHMAVCAAFSSSNKAYTISTLVLSAQHYHKEAFHTLLRLGATVRGMTMKDRSILLSRLLKPKGWGIMEKILEQDLFTEIIQPLDALVIDFIARGAPTWIIRSMLDRGADPNTVVIKRGVTIRTPLSAAIERGSVEVAELLFERGASLNGVEDGGRLWHRGMVIRQTYKHIPVFAAAGHMARTGSTDMMDLVLRRGADINHEAPVGVRRAIRHGVINKVKKTPVLAYVEALLELPGKALNGREDRLGYFFDHGVRPHVLKLQQSRWTWVPNHHRRFALKMLLAVEAYLGNWGLRSLHDFWILTMIVFVLERRLSLVKP